MRKKCLCIHEHYNYGNDIPTSDNTQYGKYNTTDLAKVQVFLIWWVYTSITLNNAGSSTR